MSVKVKVTAEYKLHGIDEKNGQARNAALTKNITDWLNGDITMSTLVAVDGATLIFETYEDTGRYGKNLDRHTIASNRDDD